MTGVVYRVMTNKGYGFARTDNGDSYFLHVAEFIDRDEFNRLRKGVGVEFEPGDEKRAMKVRLL